MADLRQACDRCHGKKLRCPKQHGSPICVRCAKAKVSCVFSPPTRALRPIAAPPQQQPDALGFDWNSLLAFDQISNGMANDAATQNQNPFVTTPPVSDNSDNSPQSETAILAQLMTGLDRLHRGFPVSDVHKHMSVEDMKQVSQNPDAKFDLQRTLEQLLQNGQELSQIYPKVLQKAKHHINRPTGDNSCAIPDCVHYMRQSLRPRQPPILDHSLLNLLIACHLRLIDILDNIMDHARVCAHVFSQLPKESEPNFDIPEIRIGSFVAPRDSAASLVTTMLVDLQASLNARRQDAFKLVVSAAGEHSIEGQVLIMQCEILGQRGKDSLNDMRQLREQMSVTGILR
ncbi:hypothetical protein B0T10DRAFT_566504 [Thelonectria olida]|uniref:Zn(2)-C6 fungal-type domain-containing protein n=1 Tax=Thelonectria olida TaxID=1576542 RepID=A0A9P8VWI8_9HYPO|nr:hypothetical protein B0T10DRAFT_566504 [Thelonectria olida]